MNLEQENSANDFEQPPSSGVESVETSKSGVDAPATTYEITPAIEELAIEPVAETPTEAPTHPTIQETQANLGEKTSELFDLTMTRVNDNAPVAKQVVTRFNDYRAAA